MKTDGRAWGPGPRKRDQYDYDSELRYIDDGNPNFFDPEPLSTGTHPESRRAVTSIGIAISSQTRVAIGEPLPVPHR